VDTNSYLQLRNQLIQYRGMINNQQVIAIHPTLYMHLVYQHLLSQSQVSTDSFTTTLTNNNNIVTPKTNNNSRKENVNQVKNSINPKKRKAVSPKKNSAKSKA